ncbi:DUF2290 domain-containing protein [Paracoccus sp. 11-3]|uniref:DUF2290 domain-containing protein n=1 Tax=Paracoccus amoyensis TaxID=2760093 RepID=A0A926JDE3_9RHOB|nr:DUF2290 domain-containing protein [Paracoccus xiamenensis]MBC9247509.1 DUF2290 domain-containing protein [Paracoccus amoyensis]NHF74858.1 DUF2290 domain-containing protein [Paracoccus xiamenensis]
MNIESFNRSIRAVDAVLADLNLLEGTVYNCSLPRSMDFNQTCLTSKDYNEIYETGLRLSHYNFLLLDLAYFQFTHKGPTEWALAFYPNPRITGSIEALSEFKEFSVARDSGEISEEEFSELSTSMPINYYVPRFRYEFSESQFRPVQHPGAHFHIGMSGEDRWGSSRRLSPLSFCYLMLKYYYPEHWWPLSRFSQSREDWASPKILEYCLDKKLENSLRNDGVSHLFCEEERPGLHFSTV